MSRGATRPALRRLRSVHRRMSWATFERFPRRLGWKHEYYGGKAHVTPAKLMVTLLLELGPRVDTRRKGLRPVTPDDAPALREPFLAAFAQTPEYANHPARLFRQKADEYIEGFFGEVRGEWSPASVVAEIRGQVVGAVLVKRRPSGWLLDCLFVHPAHGRRGWATDLATRAVRSLRAEGAPSLHSHVHIANEPSLAWHQRFGFREMPDLWVATHRARFYSDELKRKREPACLAESERATLEAQAKSWWAEAGRLEALERQDFWLAHPRLD